MPENKDIVVSGRISQEDFEILERIAEKEDLYISGAVRKAVKFYILSQQYEQQGE